MLTVTGSPVGPFADAVLTVLKADSVLATLASGGIYTALPLRMRLTSPYVIVGHQQMGPSDAAMQIEGGQITLTVDVWSEANGPHPARAIQSRIRALLQRRDVAVSGFALVLGSVTCDEELVFADKDPDIPERSLFHGIQRWTAYLEEAA